MRRFDTPVLITVMMVVALSICLSACQEKALLTDVSVAPEVITPNADGIADLTKITFSLNREATVSITLEDERGRGYVFRPPKTLGFDEDPYTVYFAGVVEPYTLPGESLDYTVLKRMLQNGTYTWKIHAEGAEEAATVTGTLVIQDADTALPGIRGFSVSPKRFSPNQDGIDDRVRINLTLEKDVEESRVYLEGANGETRHIAEDEQRTKPNAKGWHTYDYDGGIDLGSEPPEDGIYTLYAEARDAMGQRVIVSNTLEIVNAGLPRAYILNGEVEYSANTLVISETLCFTVTVENDSTTYLRTIGPWPGATYRSEQNHNTLGWEEESGTFRLAMNYDTSLRDYPYRWGIGRPGEDLVQIGEHWYLPPEARSTVTGCVKITEVPNRNPLYYWMGLIHEDVGIRNVNNRVDPNFVTIWEP